jgi:hypothetical protein
LWDGGRFPLCRGVKNAIHILLKCPETKSWRYQFLSAGWLKINEEVAYRKIVGCNSIYKLMGLEKCLHRVRCKWENEISNQGGRAEDDGVEL